MSSAMILTPWATRLLMLAALPAALTVPVEKYICVMPGASS